MQDAVLRVCLKKRIIGHSFRGYTEVAKTLLESGADVDVLMSAFPLLSLLSFRREKRGIPGCFSCTIITQRCTMRNTNMRECRKDESN